MQIIDRFHCLCICWHTSLFLYYCMEATDLWVVTISDTVQGQELVYWPGVDVLAKRIRLVLNRCWNIWWIFWFSSHKHLFMRGWVFISMLSQNDQNSCFLCTCSILVAPSSPSNAKQLTNNWKISITKEKLTKKLFHVKSNY